MVEWGCGLQDPRNARYTARRRRRAPRPARSGAQARRGYCGSAGARRLARGTMGRLGVTSCCRDGRRGDCDHDSDWHAGIFVIEPPWLTHSRSLPTSGPRSLSGARMNAGAGVGRWIPTAMGSFDTEVRPAVPTVSFCNGLRRGKARAWRRHTDLAMSLPASIRRT